MANYLPRIMDSLLREELRAFGAVLLTGPKWCGKTTTARQAANSTLYMQSPDDQDAYLRLAEISPSLLLEGDKPRLIDEWQMAPRLWDAVRHDVDLRGQAGLYILTGSTSVDESKLRHSGTGRISRLRMHTMSLYESGDSAGTVSMSALFGSPDGIAAKSALRVADYARLVVRGGWPGSVGKGDEVNRRQIAGYCDAIVKSDISTVDGVSRDERKATAVLRSYARHIGTQAAMTTIHQDVVQNGSGMHINTLDSYLNALNRLFVIDELPAWSPQLRSKAAIRSSGTRHFADPAIAAHFLQASARDLMFDVRTFVFLFESLAVRDLRVYAQSLGGSLSHYRDSYGLEADAIIHLPDGRWAAAEVKLGDSMAEEAAGNLLDLKAKVDAERMRGPSFLMVVTGGELAYRRPDGVLVVPLGCLKP
jgi:uncharacterized protein